MNSNPSPREAALQAAGVISAAPTGVVAFNSEGRIAVVGDAESVAGFCRGLSSELRMSEVIISAHSGVSRGRLHLAGHLGDFSLMLEQGGEEPVLLAEADMVVDLVVAGQRPLWEAVMKPFGYYSAADAAAWPELWDVTAQMVGTFQKPRFFNYNPDICAHGRSGLEACNRCVAACPAQAITALAEQVSIDPYLCQGGGVCATVCPTGAMTYAYPDVDTTLERLRVLITHYRKQTTQAPVILFCDQATAETLPGGLPDHWLLLPQEELASVGIEVWLAALAYGAAAVMLVESPGLSSAVRIALLGQSEIANTVLISLGYPAAVQHWSDDELPEPALMPERPGATFAGAGDKRQLLFTALDHLYDGAPQQPPVTALPAHAPLGHIQVAEDRCTLCMACASVCPSKALSAADDTPRLEFYEINCVQCGLCQQACPESAIRLEPRLLHDPALRRAASVLNEEAPFCCVSCGTPFATRQVIERMMDKLSGHPMFADEAARGRLKMCGDCKVIDMMRASA